MVGEIEIYIYRQVVISGGVLAAVVASDIGPRRNHKTVFIIRL